MATPMAITTQALSAAGTGFVTKMVAQRVTGQFTDWLVAGGIGVAGFFGATTGRGVVENVSLGAVNGASAYIGVKMAEMLQAQMQNGNGQGSQYYPYARPRLVSYGTGARERNPMEEEKVKKTTSYKRSVIEI